MAYIVAHIITFLFLCHLLSPNTLCFSRLFSFTKQGIICIIHVHRMTSFFFFNNAYYGLWPIVRVTHTQLYSY